MPRQILYSDTVALSEEITQITIRDGSIEIGNYTNKTYGYRVNIAGCWNIISLNKPISNDAINRLKNFMNNIQRDECDEFADAELYKGHVKIGREFPEIDEIIKFIYNICLEAKGYNIAKCEIVVTLRDISRSIERENNDIAYEQRRIVEVEMGFTTVSSYGVLGLVSGYGAVISWSSRDVIRYIEALFKTTIDKAVNTYKIKPLKPYLYGKTIVILDNIVSAALFHEISHMLEATYIYGSRIIGIKLCADDIDIYDEPYSYEAPSIRFFDDEGVISRKRTLIERGIVRDLHHTRATAKSMGSEPGSAYGLFNKPIPFHTTLIVKPGDWRYTEILEDTKRGLYVCGVNIATLEEGYIRVVPEYSYIIDNGELKESVKIREVKIPITNIKTISAVSRDTKIRSSYEKSWLVTEIAPMIRLEAYVQ